VLSPTAAVDDDTTEAGLAAGYLVHVAWPGARSSTCSTCLGDAARLCDRRWTQSAQRSSTPHSRIDTLPASRGKELLERALRLLVEMGQIRYPPSRGLGHACECLSNSEYTPFVQRQPPSYPCVWNCPLYSALNGCVDCSGTQSLTPALRRLEPQAPWH
jgi:hypothetical protein